MLMSAGHFAMAFDQSFLIALVLLILGSGCLKGNIAAQVGHLYAPGDVSRRTRAFTIFSTGINVGATLGPIVCGLLARSEEHTSELQSLMRISYAVFCLK